MKTHDVVVAGGGAAGWAVARALSAEGASVLLLDPEEPPARRSAAWASAGMLATAEVAQSPALAAAALRARAIWDSYAADLDVPFSPGPALLVARASAGPAERAAFEAKVAALREAGAPVEEIPPAEAVRRVPGLATVAAAALLPRDGWLDNRALLAALAASARAGGVAFERAAVDRVITGAGAARGRTAGVVTRRGERRPAGAVVVAPGAWVGEVRGVAPVPIAPVKGEMIALACPEAPPAVVRNPDLYLIPRGDRVLVGATVEEAGFDLAVRDEVRRGLRAFAASLLPRLAEAAEVEAWCGFRPATPDRLPVIGPTEPAGTYVAAGLYRHGILLAPFVGRAVADLVLRGSTDLPIEPFDPARFARG